MDTFKRQDVEELLQSYAKTYLNFRFGIPLEIPIRINNRLRTTGGRFRSYYNQRTGQRRAESIQIALFVIENGTSEEIFDILKHELIHYALFELEMDFKDGDESFIQHCKQLNVGLSHSVQKEILFYTCPKCEEKVEMNRKIRKGFYIKCPTCGSKIKTDEESERIDNRFRRII